MLGRAPTASTKIVGLIGWPVIHSLSPVMHNAAFAALGLDYCYVPLPVSPEPAENLGLAVQGLRALGLRGANVTAPHKQRVMAHAHDVTHFARLTGAVNTLWIDAGGRVLGDNTDSAGLLAYFELEGVPLQGANVLVVGAGGAARAAVTAMLSAGCASATVLNRNVDRAEKMVREVAHCIPRYVVRGIAARACDGHEMRFGRFPDDIAKASVPADVVVQCTSVGMADGALAWDPGVSLREDQVVCDLVYSPRTTALLAMAERCGARALGGVGLLVFQGALSFERWTGREAPVDVMFQAVKEPPKRTPC